MKNKQIFINIFANAFPNRMPNCSYFGNLDTNGWQCFLPIKAFDNIFVAGDKLKWPAIETSATGKYMYYYDEQTPEMIANAIKSVDMNDDYNGREIISELDLQFKKDLKLLLEDK